MKENPMSSAPQKNKATENYHIYLQTREKEKDILVRGLTVSDLDEIVRVEQETWPEEWQAPRESFANRLKLFPDGVIGVFVDGELAGVTTSMSSNFHLEDMPKKMYDKAYNWDAITDSGKIEGTQDLNGNAIYVVSVGVSSKHQGLGLGTKLVEAQKQLARRLGKEYVYLGARVPNLKAYVEYKYGVKLQMDNGSLPEIVEEATGIPLQNIADEFINKNRGDEVEFCNEVDKPHPITIRRDQDKDKPLAMERYFYWKAGQLRPVEIDGKYRAKVEFANGADRDESLDVGLIVYVNVSDKKEE